LISPGGKSEKSEIRSTKFETNSNDLNSKFKTKTSSTAAKPSVTTVSAEGVYLPEGRHPIIPFFQHSIIPVVSAAN
jgi:hypothetical protein